LTTPAFGLIFRRWGRDMATRTLKADRPFAAAIVGAIILVVLIGFSRSFFLMPLFGAKPYWAAKEPIFYLHGTVFSLWFVLLAYQTVLIRQRSLRLHRKLGYAGAGLGALVVLLGSYVGIRAANRPGGFVGVPFPPEQFLAVPIIGMALFAVFLTLAIVNRHKPVSHKRFILLASIDLLGAPVARLPLMMPAIPFWIDSVVYSAFVLALGYWDLQCRGKLRPETLFGGSALVLINFAAVPIGSTALWQSFALWLMSFAAPP
jgi:uncharacterized membrane protein YozB (DUF420 family)